MLSAVSTLKNKVVSVAAYENEAEDFFAKILSRVYGRYQKLLAERNALDFDDLLAKTVYLLEGNDHVRTSLSERFHFLLIDEYQDTNHAQYRIAKALALQHGNLCATGDPDQSIYRWRGADIRNILAFETDWPQALVVKLEENFRSTAAILRVADNLIVHNVHRKQKRLIPTQPDIDHPPGGEVVLVRGYEDELQEAQAVADHIKDLSDAGVPMGKVAIFYRVNAMSRVLEESLIRSQMPYQVVRGIEFYNRKEIKDLLAYLKVLVNPEDEISLLRIINTPARGIGKVTVDRIKQFATARGLSLYAAMGLVDQIETLSASPKAKVTAFYTFLEKAKTQIEGSVAALAEQLLVDSGLEASLLQLGADGKEALDNLSELINSAALYDERAQEGSVLDYLQEISLFSDADAYDAAGQRVALMTLHAAKGLEFTHVCIVGLEEGVLPHERSSDDEDDLEEERRLFFVGITRAQKGLHISYAKYRTVRGQTLRSIPSPFLYELGVDLFDTGSSNSRVEDIREKEKAVSPTGNRTAKSSEAEFSRGDLVRHQRFGLGRVQKYADMGAGSIVTVQFNNGVTKSLMLKYANLIKVTR